MTVIHTQYVGGSWTAPDGRESLRVLSPATGAQIATIACAGPADVSAALHAIEQAQPQWARIAPDCRADYLRAMAAAVAGNRASIAQAITGDQGKPLAEAGEEIDGVVQLFEFFANKLSSVAWVREDPLPGIRRTVRMQPVGPVAIIGTWNFPVETIAVHLAPSLAAGCTSVAIANAATPGGPAAFFDAIGQAGLPPGVVNLLLGKARDCSAALIEDPRICHISYTGSVSVGRTLAEQASRAIKRSTLELGGNAAAIVLKGSDLDRAVADIGRKRFWNAGQVCTAPNRIMVHESEYEAFADGISSLARRLAVGDPMDPKTEMGPLANAQRLEWMAEIVRDGESRGAEVLAGGERLDRPGFFFAPTVIGRVDDGALGMREEVFGPVACLTAYRDPDEAVERANACDLGLSAYVYGPDPDEARAVADRLEVGSVGINQMVVAFMDAPFGGIKLSGLGFVGSPDAMVEYQRPRLSSELI